MVFICSTAVNADNENVGKIMNGPKIVLMSSSTIVYCTKNAKKELFDIRKGCKWREMSPGGKKIISNDRCAVMTAMMIMIEHQEWFWRLC